jgi:hypothetical protein
MFRGKIKLLLSVLGLSSLLLLVYVAILSPSPLTASSKKVAVKADRFLARYIKDVVHEENCADFGFENLEEAKKARVGEPLIVKFIPLQALKGHQSGNDIATLLVDAGKLWFPVMVGEEGRAKLEVIEKDGEWLAGEFGRPKTARQVMEVTGKLYQILASQQIFPPFKVMLLNIPSLMATFVYVEGSQEKFLVPCMVQPKRFNLQNGVVYQPNEVLTSLKQLALEIDEDLFR